MSIQSESRQKAILAAVERLTELYGRPATPLEVAEATGIPLTSVRYHVRGMASRAELLSLYGGRAISLPSEPRS